MAGHEYEEAWLKMREKLEGVLPRTDGHLVVLLSTDF